MYRFEHMQVCARVCAKMATGPDVMMLSVCDADVTMGGSHITREPNGGSDHSVLVRTIARWHRLRVGVSKLTHLCVKDTYLMVDNEGQSSAVSHAI